MNDFIKNPSFPEQSQERKEDAKRKLFSPILFDPFEMTTPEAQKIHDKEMEELYRKMDQEKMKTSNTIRPLFSNEALGSLKSESDNKPLATDPADTSTGLPQPMSSDQPKPTRTPQTPAAPAAPQVPHPGASPSTVASSPQTAQYYMPSGTTSKMAANFRHIHEPRKTSCYYLLNKLKHNRILRVYGPDVFMYVGTHYQKMTRQDLARTVMTVCREEIQESGSITALKQVYDAVLYDPELSIAQAEMSDRYLPFLDGILDLNNGAFLPHTPEIFRTYVVNARYQSKFASGNITEQFLLSAMGGQLSLVDRIYEIIGYVLTPDVQAKAAFVFQGVPNSGKSVLSDLLASLVPPELTSRLDVHSLHRQFALGELDGKIMWISPDMPAKPLESTSVSAIKQLTGRDTISADIKFSPHKQFRTHAKLIMVSNYPILTKTPDDAFMQRLVAVPFRFAPDPSQMDRNLLESLLSERDALVQTAMKHYFRLRSKKYQFSGDYRVNSAEELSRYTPFSLGEDNASIECAVYSFLKECFQKGTGFLFLEDAYEAFLDWYSSSCISRNRFSSLFYRYAEELFGATKDRARRTPVSNPQYGVQGLAFRR